MTWYKIVFPLPQYYSALFKTSNSSSVRYTVTPLIVVLMISISLLLLEPVEVDLGTGLLQANCSQQTRCLPLRMWDSHC